jgi:hypothetical protein
MPALAPCSTITSSKTPKEDNDGTQCYHHPLCNKKKKTMTLPSLSFSQQFKKKKMTSNAHCSSFFFPCSSKTTPEEEGDGTMCHHHLFCNMEKQ